MRLKYDPETNSVRSRVGKQTVYIDANEICVAVKKPVYCFMWEDGHSVHEGTYAFPVQFGVHWMATTEGGNGK